ncbi:MAG: hypothetical protein ACE5EL_09110 [Anaerolineae bacterium]
MLSGQAINAIVLLATYPVALFDGTRTLARPTPGRVQWGRRPRGHPRDRAQPTLAS